MKYSVLADTYKKLEEESGKLKKAGILSDLLSKAPTDLLPTIVLMAEGRVFPAYSELKTGVATKMIIRGIVKATGISEKNVVEKFKKLGDLGLVAEACIKSKKQGTLSRKSLSVEMVSENVQKLATVTGTGSQDKKLNLIGELLVSAEPNEARYIVRLILETLRIGVAEGIVRDAISKSFNIDSKVIENAWFLNPDYGEIAQIVKQKGEGGLKKIKIEIGRPMMVMLGEKAKGLEEALDKYEHSIMDYKYDGMRTQIHKKGNKFWLFTRRLENVTDQFPDLLNIVKKGIKAKECIIEGETVGFDLRTNKPIPFQTLSRRIQRKYDIEVMVKKIPVRIFAFDILYLNGKTLLKEKYSKRRELLKKSVKEVRGKFQMAHSLETKNLKMAEEFYRKSKEDGHEGLMVKNLDAPYQPGRRVGYMLKIKPIMETLDLVLIAAEWGRGKRSNWFSSFTLACRDPDTGRYLSCGKLGTGLTDKQFKELTKKLQSLITKESGVQVQLKPEVVIEVGYEEIQKSPKYKSGFALRFPRLIRFRTSERKAEDADTIQRVKDLYKSQGRAG